MSVHVSAFVLASEGEFALDGLDAESRAEAARRWPEEDPVVLGERALTAAACVFQGHDPEPSGPNGEACSTVEFLKGQSIEAQANYHSLCYVLPPSLGALLRKGLNAQLEANREAFAWLADAASDVRAAIGADGALNLSQALLPSEACERLACVAEKALIDTNGRPYGLEVLYGRERDYATEALGSLTEAYRRWLVAASRALARIEAVAHDSDRFLSFAEAKETCRLAYGLAGPANELSALIAGSLDATEEARFPDGSGFVGGDVGEFLGEADSMDCTEWVQRCSLTAQQLARWEARAKTLCEDASFEIGSQWPGFYDYGTGPWRWRELISALAGGEVKDFRPLDEAAVLPPEKPWFLYTDDGFRCYTLPAAFADGCEDLFIGKATVDEGGEPSLVCMSPLRRAAVLASIIAAEQSADDPDSVAMRQDSRFELLARTYRVTGAGQVLGPTELKMLGLPVEHGDSLVATGMGDYFTLTRRRDSCEVA